MTTNNDLVHACDRALQGINEVKGHAIRLMQLEQQVKAAQDALAGLNAKIKQAEAQAAEIDKTDQTIRQKRTLN